MNKSLALVSGLVVMSLTGCSSQLDNQTASGSYDYLKAQQNKPIDTPASLDKPEFARDHEIPELGDGADSTLVGRKVPVTSPALVHPLVAGSHVEEGTRDAVVVFDQVDDRQPLNKAIWDSVLSFLDKHDVAVNTFDKENGRLVTDWFVVSEELEDEDSPWYALSDDITADRKRRFEFTMAVKPHGRTASLTTKLLDFEEQRGDKVSSNINELEQRREEVAILNQVIAHYEYQIQLDNTRRLAEIRQGLDSEMGFNSADEPAIVVLGKYDVVWPRMLLVLRKLGFDVKDLDKSNGLLFVTYNGGDEGWWGNLFSSDEELLEEGDYRLKLAPQGERTSVTFMNDESVAFDAKQLTDIYDSFSQVMSQDNLDI
ncbi:outer membrane protein assembly factor BamC [Salinimonas sediminis]|uniref:Outer membrane protein assembly factor BamC n=1 Tax=Salinimonas sediminis TaxID=2303538 RepID=A0A346NMN6_9ALTE|nr:outer membrane protein assembly factor BamC [Salinimonas sediminis]AXR06793.1 outer membrane protein assembly factor BamC [Salinimonas sediminis]